MNSSIAAERAGRLYNTKLPHAVQSKLKNVYVKANLDKVLQLHCQVESDLILACHLQLMAINNFAKDGDLLADLTTEQRKLFEALQEAEMDFLIA